MGFATGVSMERHYDLVAHDEIVATIEKQADLEKQAGDPSRGLEALDELEVDELENAKAEAVLTPVRHAAPVQGVKDTGTSLEKLARQFAGAGVGSSQMSVKMRQLRWNHECKGHGFSLKKRARTTVSPNGKRWTFSSRGRRCTQSCKTKRRQREELHQCCRCL